MDGINHDKYLRKRPSWKKPRYDHDEKSHETLRKLKGTMHICAIIKWQSVYEIPGELHQYYSNGSCVEKSTLIHWNLSRVAYLFLSLVSFFSFVQTIEFWKNIFK